MKRPSLPSWFEAAILPAEEKRPRWVGRTSNPVGAAERSRAGSTPALFRHCKIEYAGTLLWLHCNSVARSLPSLSL
jgi:hypothetical protein